MQLELPLYPNHQTWQEEIPHLVRWFERTFHWYEMFPLNTSNQCFKTSIPMVHLPINKHQSSGLSHCPTKISVNCWTDARKKWQKVAADPRTASSSTAWFWWIHSSRCKRKDSRTWPRWGSAGTTGDDRRWPALTGWRVGWYGGVPYIYTYIYIYIYIIFNIWFIYD